jgi:hypothetical protein
VLRVGHGQHMVRPEGTARRARANGRGKTVRHRHDGVSAIAPRRCTVSSSLALGACGDDNGGVRTPAPRAVHLPRTLRPASPAAVRVAVAVVTVVLAVSTAAAVWRLGRRSVLTTGSAPVEAVTAGVLAMSAGAGRSGSASAARRPGGRRRDRSATRLRASRTHAGHAAPPSRGSPYRCGFCIGSSCAARLIAMAPRG